MSPFFPKRCKDLTNREQMLWKARLPWWEKIELLVLFSGGIFVMAAGILRCVLIVTVSLFSSLTTHTILAY